MDPDSVLSGLLEALQAKDWERVDLLSEAMLEWLKRGGFPPTTVGPKALGDEWHKNVARFICFSARFKLDEIRKREASRKRT